MIKLIIDTNIYLNFYRLDSEQSLEMIKNLTQLVKSRKFQLILPKQIENEFIRNKNSKNAIYTDHILSFEKGLDVQFKIPHLIKSSQQIEQIKKVINKLNGLKKKAVDDYKNRVFNPSSKINQHIKTLFSHAYRPIETELILQKAWFRTLRGNPPCKGNSSFGDAIIWETILDQCVEDDLILISGDGDFESEINKEKIHELLSAEWLQKTNKSLKLYTKLGSFINENITNKKKQIKQETIQEENRLNSIFTNFEQLNYTTTPVPPNESSRLILGQVGASATNWGRIKNRCYCCGAEIDDLSALTAFSFDKCENCRNQFSPGQTCGKCGKHFHRNWLFTTINYLNDNRCNDCQNII